MQVQKLTLQEMEQVNGGLLGCGSLLGLFGKKCSIINIDADIDVDLDLDLDLGC